MTSEKTDMPQHATSPNPPTGGPWWCPSEVWVYPDSGRLTDEDDSPRVASLKPRVYLSGVIANGGTLPPEQIEANLQRFADTTTALRGKGFLVVDPTEIAADVDNPTWLDWMRVDLKALLDCNAILMMPGWEASKGARLERHIAEQLGFRVMELGDVL